MSIEKKTFKMCLDQGTAAEQQGAELVVEQYKEGILMLPPDKIENINEFNIKTYESMELQRKGMDKGIGEGEESKPDEDITIEVKSRLPENSKRYWQYNKNGEPDILLETVSVVFTKDVSQSGTSQGVPGWTTKVEADKVVYGIQNSKKDITWQDAWILDGPGLRDWFNKQDWSRWKKKFGRTWTKTGHLKHETENRVVPFSDIPDELYIKVI